MFLSVSGQCDYLIDTTSKFKINIRTHSCEIVREQDCVDIISHLNTDHRSINTRMSLISLFYRIDVGLCDRSFVRVDSFCPHVILVLIDITTCEHDM